jgi:hypothetical protein
VRIGNEADPHISGRCDESIAGDAFAEYRGDLGRGAILALMGTGMSQAHLSRVRPSFGRYRHCAKGVHRR